MTDPFAVLRGGARFKAKTAAQKHRGGGSAAASGGVAGASPRVAAPALDFFGDAAVVADSSGAAPSSKRRGGDDRRSGKRLRKVSGLSRIHDRVWCPYPPQLVSPIPPHLLDTVWMARAMTILHLPSMTGSLLRTIKYDYQVLPSAFLPRHGSGTRNPCACSRKDRVSRHHTASHAAPTTPRPHPHQQDHPPAPESPEAGAAVGTGMTLEEARVYRKSRRIYAKVSQSSPPPNSATPAQPSAMTDVQDTHSYRIRGMTFQTRFESLTTSRASGLLRGSLPRSKALGSPNCPRSRFVSLRLSCWCRATRRLRAAVPTSVALHAWCLFDMPPSLRPKQYQPWRQVGTSLA
jgi:hypothetical protein